MIATKELIEIRTLTPEEALRQLGDTADEVAESLRRAGCRGYTASAHGCPVARYMQGLGFKGFQVGASGYYRGPGHMGVMSAKGHNARGVGEFILRFDRGEYPDLEKSSYP